MSSPMSRRSSPWSAERAGVGKSLVTSLACAMAGLGKKVGILDADITGPSIPKAFGIHTGRGQRAGHHPETSKGGVEVMSLNLPSPRMRPTRHLARPGHCRYCQAVLGPTSSGGELDYLFVDMPPLEPVTCPRPCSSPCPWTGSSWSPLPKIW